MLSTSLNESEVSPKKTSVGRGMVNTLIITLITLFCTQLVQE